MKWLKKLIAKVDYDDRVAEEEVAVTQEVAEEELTPPKSHVAYHYPKNEFKFPLIPDEEKEARTGQLGHVDEKPKAYEDTKIDKQPERESTYNPTTNQSTVKIDTIEHRKPFKPSQIPSPIYGFRSRPAVDSEELLQTMRQEWEQKEEVEKEAVQAVSDNLSIHSEEEIVVESEVNEETAVNVKIEEPHDSHEEFLEEELHVLQEEDIEFHALSREDTLEEEKVVEAPIKKTVVMETPEESEGTVEKEKQPERKRSKVPFNVLMLNSDKRKQPEKVLPTQESTPSEQVEKVVPTKENKEKILSQDTKREETAENYYFPSTELLTPPIIREGDQEWLEEQSALLDQTLEHFNVRAKVVHVSQGPSVTRFEVQPEPGVKVNKITNLSDDLKLSLAARDIRMEAPIPGKQAIGIEIPNPVSRPVFISEILEDPAFRHSESPLTTVLGLDISGKPVVTDLNKMPHGLIAGATGSGKSVCINSILVSLLYKATPEDVRLLLIDPKMVELAPYNRIPHLVTPVITDVKTATAALKWTVEEMERRYELFAHTGVRDIKRFNDKAMEAGQYSQKLPFIVVVIDELADLMMMAPNDVEDAICRIAQKARACGIHLIIATQRPSVDVITGLIKANVPTRIAFSVSSQVDSRTIIDSAGAERLLGRGDMLFLDNGASKPVRLQGTFVTDDEIEKIVHHVRNQQDPEFLFHQDELLKKIQLVEDDDDLYSDACEFVVEQGSASTSSLQRRFRIGYNRAARLMEMMESQGVISEARGSKPRDVLINDMDLENL
ncbi:DNA translocase FtsK [Mangrovibacillus cuniculi]|uniref:DNA translocase FtsK n=1 Tax=Mangrovibacillus cuniculi TaxID=2593652 RepID=A0A7S8CC48_9BACI|nr:DNA translocase FtsK [Mangrovibacillus cuniculi]QPC47264.1 DNA translocase FtsK [Mangrovibacillus cuniculi]